MGHAADLVPSRPRSRWRGPLTGVAVFAGIVAGWLGWLMWQAAVEARSPLPGGDGVQGRCAVWFIGSSSISRWPSLGDAMEPWFAHNRGVGGARVRQLIPRFTNESGVAAPSAIVFYGGDNDIARGESVRDALGDVKALLAAGDRRFRTVPVLLLSIKYSPKRWSHRADIAAFNKGLARIAAARTRTSYIDISSALLVNGRPGPFFEADGIHVTPPTYRLWNGLVRDALGRHLPDAPACLSGGRRG